MSSLGYVNAKQRESFLLREDGRFLIRQIEPEHGSVEIYGRVPDGKFLEHLLHEDSEVAFRILTERSLPDTQTVDFESPVKLDMLERQAKSINKQNRTFDVVLATQMPVKTIDFLRDEIVDEILVMSGLQFSEQISLLDSHATNSVSNVLGSIRKLHISNSELLGTVHMGESMDAQIAFQNVVDGHLTDVSVKVQRLDSMFVEAGQFHVIDGTTFEGPLKLVTQGLLIEGSLVVKGADPAAKIL